MEPTASSLLEWLNSSLKDVEHEAFRKAKSVKKVEIKSLMDGIMVASNTQRLIITLENQSGVNTIVSAVVKMEPESGEWNELTKTYSLMDCELYMYGETLKMMENIAMEYESKKDKLWPDSYLLGNNKLLIQDLGPLGYKTVPTNKLLNLDHMLVAMKGLGKYHALTMVMKEKGKLNTSKFSLPPMQLKTSYNNNFFTLGIWTVADIVETWGPEWSEVPSRLRKAVEGVAEKLYDGCMAVNDSPWNVLNHGDTNMRNFLYLYKPDSDVPIDIKFVDFQICYYGNGAHDLGMALYGSGHPEDREANLDLLLEAYTTSLRGSCIKYNYRGFVPNKSEVAAYLLKLRYWTTMMSITFLPYLLYNDRIDFGKEALVFMGKTESLKTTMDLSVFKEELIVKILKIELKGALRDKII